MKSHRLTQLICSLSRVQSLTPLYTLSIYRTPAVSSSHWTTAGKFRNSFTCTNSCKMFTLCCVPRCLQILFLQNFILAICLTHEVKLGYCKLIYYAFFSYPRIRGFFLWWCRNFVEKINITGKTVVPSTDLAFPGECAPFILSVSLVSKTAFKLNPKLGSRAVIEEARDWISVLKEGYSLSGKIINLYQIYIDIQAPDNALQTTHKCWG